LKIERADPSCLVNCLVRFLFLIARCTLLLVPLVFSISCGKKGPPTIKAYEKPQPPSGLTAYHREGRMILTWTYPDTLRSSLKGFQVLRSEKDGFERIGAVTGSKSSFADETFKLDVACSYKVVAESLKGVLSVDSNIIVLTPKPVPPPPGDVRVSVKPDSVVISWTGSGEGACYNIYRTAEKGRYGNSPLNKAPVCVTSFTDAVVSPEKSVFYEVSALWMTDIRDEGAASEEQEVNPSRFVPSAPSDLRVVTTDAKTFLMWKESPEPWVRSYRVYRKIDSEQEFALVGEVKLPTFTDTKIDKKIWYMIKAVGPVAESEPLGGEVAK
jgi:hypothetical protein